MIIQAERARERTLQANCGADFWSQIKVVEPGCGAESWSRDVVMRLNHVADVLSEDTPQMILQVKTILKFARAGNSDPSQLHHPQT